MNCQKIVAALAIAAGILASEAFAAPDVTPAAANAPGDIAGRFYVSPMFSYTFANRARETDNATGGLFAIGKQVNPYANLEAYGSYNRYAAKLDGAKDGDLLTAGLAVVGFPFTRSEGNLGSWLGGAYGLIGVNWADGSNLPLREQKYDQNRSGYAFDLGLGYLARIPFIRFASLRLDVRYRMDFVNKPFASVEIHDERNDKPNINDVVASIGLLIPIGALPPPPPPPPPPQVVEPLAPADSDGDGIADAIDQCRDTPAGTPVDGKGCPLAPPCKNREPGQKLDLSGCAAGDVIILRGVNFEFDKAELTVNAKILLDDVVSSLVARPDLKIELNGYTDDKGPDVYNLQLSQRRAQAVVDYLVGRGIDATRLAARGWGEASPVADNATDEGREENRRVELRVTEGGPGELALPAAPDASVGSAPPQATEAPLPADASPTQ